MTTLDQIRLLETKVESAVAKMQQLQAENDALRNKCAELTNALESKTEQLLAFTTNKEEIEEGIKNALDRLNYIENSVLGSGSSNPNGQGSIHITPGAGLSSIEPITEDVYSGKVANENNFLGNTSVTHENDANVGVTDNGTTEASYTEGSDNSAATTSSEVVQNVEYNTQASNDDNFSSTQESVTDKSSGPNFNSMEMTQQQPETAVPENPTNKDNNDEGDQDTFEYDIF